MSAGQILIFQPQHVKKLCASSCKIMRKKLAHEEGGGTFSTSNHTILYRFASHLFLSAAYRRLSCLYQGLLHDTLTRYPAVFFRYVYSKIIAAKYLCHFARCAAPTHRIQYRIAHETEHSHAPAGYLGWHQGRMLSVRLVSFVWDQNILYLSGVILQIPFGQSIAFPFVRAVFFRRTVFDVYRDVFNGVLRVQILSCGLGPSNLFVLQSNLYSLKVQAT